MIKFDSFRSPALTEATTFRVPKKMLVIVEISCGKYKLGWWEIHQDI